MGSARPVVDVPRDVLDYLGEQSTLTLATASPTGVPHAATLTYVNDGPTLYVWTRPETTTARQVQGNPTVAFAIDDYAPDWRQTKGIQGMGECQPVLDSDATTGIVERYEQKFPALASALTAGVWFFRITPTELRLIDNARGSGEAGAQAVGIEYHRDVVYSVFRDLPPQEVETMGSQLQTIHVKAGEVIVRQGAPAEKFFIIVDGEVEVLREQDGQQRVLNELTAGQFFGEVAILRDMPRTATVRARTPATLLAMERETFRSLVAQSLGATQDFDRVIQERLERTEG